MIKCYCGHTINCDCVKETLEQQIRPHAQYWDCYNDCPLDYDHTNKLVKITENFAIEFAVWCVGYRDKNRNVDGDILHSKSKYDNVYTTEELLEIYKKEKGL